MVLLIYACVSKETPRTPWRSLKKSEFLWWLLKMRFFYKIKILGILWYASPRCTLASFVTAGGMAFIFEKGAVECAGALA